MRWLLLVVLLSACAPLQVKPSAGPVEFDLSGRIAARYRDDAFSGIVSWRHAGEGDDMLISTPMGQGVARIVRQGEAVQLTTADGKEHRANDVEDLTERVLGFRVPLVGLADVVQGRSSTDLEGRGWKFEVQERDPQGRPARLRATYQGIDLRLAVTQWN